MLYNYRATSQDGRQSDGTIDASSVDGAIAALQRRSLIVISVKEAQTGSFLSSGIVIFERVSMGEVVVLSRQLSTLFEAKVAVLDAFKLLASEAENPLLKKTLNQMVDDIQSGVQISAAMAKHPKVFSSFYVNMVKSGEESGKLSESLQYLADYLERSFELVSKVRNALIYPSFVIVSFIVIMIIMLVVVIPQLTAVLADSGQELPFATKFVVLISDFFVRFWPLIGLAAIGAGIFFVWYRKTPVGDASISRALLAFPYIGALYRKLYLSRIADNMDTMLTSGISMVRAIEIPADVVGDATYKHIMLDAMEKVRGGASFSDALSQYREMPRIIVQMSRIGEETGKLGYVLKTIARFYKREVDTSIDTIVSLIEPMMIVSLGLGVGFLLMAVLGPIYNMTSNM